MSTQIHTALIAAFENLLNPFFGDDLRKVFSKEGYRKVFPQHTKFTDDHSVEIRTPIKFESNNDLLRFLKNEKKIAPQTGAEIRGSIL